MYLKKLGLGTGLLGQIGLPALFLVNFAMAAESSFPKLVDPASNYGPDDRDDYYTDLALAVEQAVAEMAWPDPDAEDQAELYEMIEITFPSHRTTMDRYSEGGPPIETVRCQSDLSTVRRFLEDYAVASARPEVATLAEAVLQAERALLTERELATVRAALRAYREHGFGDPLKRSDRVFALSVGQSKAPCVSMDDSDCAALEVKLAQFTYAYRAERSGA